MSPWVCAQSAPVETAGVATENVVVPQSAPQLDLRETGGHQTWLSETEVSRVVEGRRTEVSSVAAPSARGGPGADAIRREGKDGAEDEADVLPVAGDRPRVPVDRAPGVRPALCVGFGRTVVSEPEVPITLPGAAVQSEATARRPPTRALRIA